MSLNPKTLATLQKAGAAVQAAEVELKRVQEQLAEKVKVGMTTNPFNAANDTTFEGWKGVARLTSAMSRVEAELRSIYAAAQQLIADQLPATTVPVLAGPAPSINERLAKKTATSPSDVKVKKPAKTITLPSPPVKTEKAAKKAAKAPVAKKVLVKALVKALDSSKGVQGNAAKLLTYLTTELSPTEFSAINQTNASKATGIPLGSLTATIKRLIDAGSITDSGNRTFKLAATPAIEPSAPTVA